MQKQLVIILAVLLLIGCGTRPVPQAPANDEPKLALRAELRIGDNPDESARLPFEITTVYEHQEPSVNAPYHVGGGEWTFFKCQSSSDRSVVFTVGVSSQESGGKTPVSWGKALLAVKDREAGADSSNCSARDSREHSPRP